MSPRAEETRCICSARRALEWSCKSQEQLSLSISNPQREFSSNRRRERNRWPQRRKNITGLCRSLSPRPRGPTSPHMFSLNHAWRFPTAFHIDLHSCHGDEHHGEAHKYHGCATLWPFYGLYYFPFTYMQDILQDNSIKPDSWLTENSTQRRLTDTLH